jgi:chromosome segregation ATPase
MSVFKRSKILNLQHKEQEYCVKPKDIARLDKLQRCETGKAESQELAGNLYLEINQCKNDLADLQKSAAEKDQHIEKMSSLLEELNRERDNLQTQLEQCQHDKETLIAQAGHQASQIDTLKGQLAEAIRMSSSAAIIPDLDQIRTKNATLIKEKKDLLQALAALRQNEDGQQKTIAKLRKDKAYLRQHIKNIEASFTKRIEAQEAFHQEAIQRHEAILAKPAWPRLQRRITRLDRSLPRWKH